MRTDLSVATAALAAVLVASEAAASGAGAAIFVSRPTQRPVQQASCETGACGPNGPCAAGQPLGFAGVDPETPAPCTAEGGCYPNRPTFGFTPTRWRRWPGADYGGPAPDLADPGDNLPVIEPPSAADEDKSSPPPIEDVPSADEEAEEPSVPPAGPFEAAPPAPAPGPAFDRNLPGVEIDLPPLPEVGPPPAPQPAVPGGFQDGPPALPFGFSEPRGPAPPSDLGPPPRPAFRTMPARLPKPSATDAPPALPAGFTAVAPQSVLRRLPATRPTVRYDAAVRPVVAHQPVR